MLMVVLPVTGKQRIPRAQKVARLRELLESKNMTQMPCVYDGFTARMVEDMGFDLTFMTGFGVSATYGLPDAGLASAAEMFRSAEIIANSLDKIPCIGDGDTGFGNPANVKRTVIKYAQAGMSGIMIEDQVMPKRCGHTKGKEVVDREEAYRRIRSAVEAREEMGEDIVILARTDARQTHSLDEAIERCREFRKLGADWTFLEAPQSEEEMIRYCQEVDGPKMVNCLEFGKTPILHRARLEEMGFSVAAYPLTLLSSAAKAMKESLHRLLRQHNEGSTETTEDLDLILSFDELCDRVGFNEYYEDLEKLE
jgi:2-methylisocitrate lyase-like PEP mutase family enzyme